MSILENATKSFNAFENIVKNVLVNHNKYYKDGNEEIKTKIIKIAEETLVENFSEDQIVKLGSENEMSMYFSLIQDIENELHDEQISPNKMKGYLTKYCDSKDLKGKERKQFGENFAKALDIYNSVFQEALKTPSIVSKLTNIKA